MIEVNAHKVIAELCVQFAHEIYEECATRYNHWYQLHPNRQQFVRMCAPTLVQDARRTLSFMLGRDDVSQEDKDRIYQALMLDMTIPEADKRAKFDAKQVAKWLN